MLVQQELNGGTVLKLTINNISMIAVTWKIKETIDCQNSYGLLQSFSRVQYSRSSNAILVFPLPTAAAHLQSSRHSGL